MKRKHSRRGITSLVETLVAISLSSTMFLVSAAFLNRVIHGEPQMRRQAQSVLSLNRLARQFRADVHAAAEVALEDGGRQLRVDRIDEEQIRYSVKGASIARVLTRGKAVAHRERYALTEEQARFELSGEAPLRQAVLRMRRPAPSSKPSFASRSGNGATYRELEIAAIVGRDNRFVNEAKQGDAP